MGCKKEKEEKITVTPSSITLNVGQKTNIYASPNSDGCTFTSYNSAIAEVSGSGEVTEKKVGETTVN